MIPRSWIQSCPIGLNTSPFVFPLGGWWVCDLSDAAVSKTYLASFAVSAAGAAAALQTYICVRDTKQWIKSDRTGAQHVQNQF